RTRDLLSIRFAGVDNRYTVADLAMRTRDDVDGRHGTNLSGCGSSRIDCSFYGTDFASDYRGYETRIDLLISDEFYIRRFHHGIRRFDHRDQSHTFDHSKCFHKNVPMRQCKYKA